MALEQIKETLQYHFKPFTGEKAPSEAEQLEAFNGKEFPRKEVETYWVKKCVSNKEWNTYYSQLNYCPLEKEGEGIWIGYIIAGYDITFPEGVRILTDEELVQVDSFRKSNNLTPLALV